MTARQVLASALALLDGGKAHTTPPRGTTFLAIDDNGLKVRPADPRAVAWTSVGAIAWVAPGQDEGFASLSYYGQQAAEAFEQAALLQGYANSVELDRAGFTSVYQAFTCAMNQCEPVNRRPLRSVGTGSNPRGATT